MPPPQQDGCIESVSGNFINALFHFSKILGFTLAEVLITLGIVGIIASLTIPSLIDKYKEKEYSTKLKKLYNIMSIAVNNAILENGTVDEWGLTGSWNNTEENQNIIIDKIAPYLNIIERCKTASDCNAKKYSTKYLDNSKNGDAIPRILLNDGSTITSIYIVHSLCKTSRGAGAYLSNVCATIDFDLNGNKAPNILGIDIYSFYITKNGFYPKGTKGDQTETFNNRCLGRTGTQPGQGCTAWVIYNENMDYLHCNDLSWEGKLKCK